MISKAQDMNNNIFILPDAFNVYFNLFLRLYFEKQVEPNEIKIQIMINIVQQMTSDPPKTVVAFSENELSV